MFDFNTAMRLDDNGGPIPGSWIYPPSGYDTGTVDASTMPDPADVAFTRVMAGHGLEPGIIIPGGLKRFDVEKRGDKAGWYVFYEDGIPAGRFGNWQTGLDEKWCSKKRHEVDPATWAEHDRRMAKRDKQRRQEEKKRHTVAAGNAEQIWREATPAPADHQYLVKKGVAPHDLKVGTDGRLIVPVQDNNKAIHSIQYIPANGKKLFLSGGAIQGHYFTIHGEGSRCYLCEGYATAATIHAATGATVFVGFNAANLPKVAKALKEKFPTARIFVAGDDDQHTAGNPGRKYAMEAAAILGTIPVFPKFKNPDGKATSDFNDLQRVEGLDAVKALFESGTDGGYLKEALFTAADFRRIEVPPKTYHLFPWLWAGSYGVLSGERGIGKTWFSLGVADAVTRGAGFGPWRCEEPAACLYVEGEMPLTDDQERIDIMGLARGRKKPLFILSDAYVCEVLKRPSINIGCEETRQYLRDLIISHGIKIVFLDNVASLTPGMDENSKMEWDPVNQWLIGLRYAGVSPYLIHHLGKNGDQRGTSGREDNIDISIKLTKPHGYRSTDGARFVVCFPKKRVSHSHLPLIADLEMQYRPDRSGDHIWTYGGPTRNMLLSVLDYLVIGGTQADAAKALNISKGQVSKLRKKLEEDGLITPKNILTKNGEAALIEAGFAP